MQFYLKIAFVALLCLPIVYCGYRFFCSLLDHAITGRKKKVKK
jgi:hypothetical protein